MGAQTRTPWGVWLLVVGIVCLATSSVQADILKFKMTNDTLPVLPGFKRVTEKTEYTPELGYGWTRGNRVRWRKLNYGQSWQQIVITGTFPDVITGSWVAPGRCTYRTGGEEPFDFQDEAEFRVDVPPGEYVAHMILGDYYYRLGLVKNLAKPYAVAVNGVKQVDVRFTDEQIADIFFEHEYTEYDPRISYWRRFAKPHFDRTTHQLPVESDGSLRITIRGLPITMLAIWPKAETAAAEAWLAELDKIREQSCELREIKRKEAEEIESFTPTQAQQKQGYVVFAHDVMEEIYPETTPTAKAIESDIKLFAARGEFESATFGIYPLRQINDLRVTVGELKNENGDTFPHDRIDVRFVKYMREPANQHWDYKPPAGTGLAYVVRPVALVAWEKITVLDGVTRQCWLRFDVPKDQPAGDYTGAVTITPSNAPPTKRKLQLKVLPIRLRTLSEDDRYIDLSISYIYLRHPHIWPGTDEKEMSKKLMKAWTDYGFNMVQAGFGLLTDHLKWVDGKAELDFTLMEEWLKGWTEAGVTPKAVQFSDALHTLALHFTKSKKGFHWYGHTVDELKTLFPENYDEAYVAAARAIDEEFKKRGWPMPVFYEGGEGGGHESGRYYETRLFGLCHKAGVRSSISLSGDMAYFKEIVPLVWAPYDYYFNLEKYEWMKERNINMFFKAYFHRFERGHFCWRINAKGHHAETFCYGSWWDPYNSFSSGEGSYGVAMPSRDNEGINPKVWAERHVREGHDDARYLFDLEWLIREANKRGKKEVVEAAAEARKTLDRIAEAVNPDLDYYRQTGNYPSPKVYQRIRWRVAREIMNLQDVLKRAGIELE